MSGLIKASQDARTSDHAKATALGTAAASFAFIFLWSFTMFNIVPCWLFGTEIWPQEVRAKGYSMTVLGWAIGCGVTGFVIPIMLTRLGWITFLFFGAMNAVSAPIIYFFYPEVAGRTLEEVNLLFTNDSLLVSKNVGSYYARLNAANGSVAVAARQLFDEADLLELRKAGNQEEINSQKHVHEALTVENDTQTNRGEKWIL